MKWITCDSVGDEISRRILEYANCEFALDRLIDLHGSPAKKDVANYKKQVRQIRVAILQSNEYFQSSKLSSVATKPNSLYYGAMSLTVACMLFRGDGDYSLDRLRLNRKNSHHGLQFNASGSNRNRKHNNLLENCNVSRTPNGHFKNWFSTLRTDYPSFALTVYESSENAPVILLDAGIATRVSHGRFRRNASLSELIASMPDLYSELMRFGMAERQVAGKTVVTLDDEGNTKGIRWLLFDAQSPEALQCVLNRFLCDRPAFSIFLSKDGKQARVETFGSGEMSLRYPSTRLSLKGDQIYYADDQSAMEVVDVFQLLFGLSMLSRYYPDIWMDFVESHSTDAMLVERFCMQVESKFKALILSEIENDTYVFSQNLSPIDPRQTL